MGAIPQHSYARKGKQAICAGGGWGAGRVVLNWEVADNEKRRIVGIGIVSDFALFNNKAVCIPLTTTTMLASAHV